MGGVGIIGGWEIFGKLIKGGIDGIENRKHRLLKYIFQTNTSIRMQFSFSNSASIFLGTAVN